MREFAAQARHTLRFMASNLVGKVQKVIWERFPEHNPGKSCAGTLHAVPAVGGQGVKPWPLMGKIRWRRPHDVHKNIIGSRVRRARLWSQPRLTQQQLADCVASLGTQIDRAGIGKIEIGLCRMKGAACPAPEI